MSKSITPNHREILSAQGLTGSPEYLTSTNGALNVNAAISLTGSPIPIIGATTAVGVAIVDGSGNQITSFGGGTQYPELTTTSPSTATAVLGRYKTTPPVLTDGQMYMPQLDSSGNLNVNVKAGSGSGLSVVDSTGFIAGSSSFVPSGGVYNDSVANLVPGQQGALRLTADRRLKVDVSSSVVQINNDQIVGNSIATTNDGTQLVSLAGPTGDPIDTVGDSLSVQVKNTGSVITGNPNQSAQVGVPARLEVPFSTSVVQPVAFTDVSNYRWVCVQITSTGTTSLATWQTSNDGINWLGMGLNLTSNLGATIPVISSATNNMWSGPLQGRYFRLNITAITAGVTQGVIEFFASPAVNLQTTSTVASVSTTPTDALAQSTSLEVVNANLLFNGTTYDRWRAANIATGTTGLGIAATGAMGISSNATNVNLGAYAPLQLDSQGSLRITTAAGKPLSTDKATINGIDIATSADGTQLVSLAGPTGDLIDTTGSSLNVVRTNAAPNPLSNGPLVGQTKIAVTGTNVQLNASQVLLNGIIISAPSGNTAPVSIGGPGVNNNTGGTGNGYLLPAGASVSFAVTNTNTVYINGTANDYVSWAAS